MWNQYNISAKLHRKRIDENYTIQILNPIDLNIACVNSFKDGTDASFDETNLTFYSDEYIEVNNGDIIQFNYLGLTRWVIVNDRKDELYTLAPTSYEYNVEAVELSKILSQFNINLDFPRSNKYQLFGKNFRNLLEVVERMLENVYLQPDDARKTFMIVEGFTARLAAKLRNHTDVPDMSFKKSNLYGALTFIFDMIGAIPKIIIQDGYMLLDMLELKESQEVVNIPLDSCVAYSGASNNSERGSEIFLEASNVTSPNAIKELWLNFTVEAGAWDETKAILESQEGFGYIIEAKVYCKGSYAGFPKTITDRLVPKDLFDVMNYNDQNKCAYYTPGSKTIEGFGRTIRENAYGSEIAWSSIFDVKPTLNSDLKEFFIYIKMQALSDSEFITVQKDDLANIHTYSQVQTSASSRYTDYYGVSSNIKSKIEKLGNATVYKTVTFVNNDEVIIHPLLAVDKQNGYIITGRTITVDTNEVTIVYEQSSDHAKLNEFISIHEPIFNVGYDLANATTRHVSYKEFVEVGGKPTPLKENNNPSITDMGINAYMNTIRLVKNSGYGTIKDGYYISQDAIPGKILHCPVKTDNGKGHNVAIIKPYNHMHMGYKIIRSGSIYEKEGVKYTDGFGNVETVGVFFGEIPDSTKINNIDAMPDLTGVSSIQNITPLIKLGNLSQESHTESEPVSDYPYTPIHHHVFSGDVKQGWYEIPVFETPVFPEKRSITDISIRIQATGYIQTGWFGENDRTAYMHVTSTDAEAGELPGFYRTPIFGYYGNSESDRRIVGFIESVRSETLRADRRKVILPTVTLTANAYLKDYVKIRVGSLGVIDKPLLDEYEGTKGADRTKFRFAMFTVDNIISSAYIRNGRFDIDMKIDTTKEVEIVVNGGTGVMKISKASTETTNIAYELHAVALDKNYIIGKGLTNRNQLFNNEMYEEVQVWISDELYSRYADVNPLGSKINLSNIDYRGSSERYEVVRIHHDAKEIIGKKSISLVGKIFDSNINGYRYELIVAKNWPNGYDEPYDTMVEICFSFRSERSNLSLTDHPFKLYRTNRQLIIYDTDNNALALR